MAFLGDLFAKSPIRPMQRHIHSAVTCARAVLPLFEDMAAGRTDRLREHREAIDALEHEADAVKNEIRGHLPKRLFMAMERRDLLEILDFQDSIADVAQDIAGLVEQRGMTLPETLAEPVMALVRRVVAACEHAEKIVDELDELIETGFGDRETARVEAMVDELNRIESDTDDLAEVIQRRLFALEGELGVSTVFWYQLVNWIADLADYAERVGNRIRLLIAR
jgi:predicted phosphate transport protein (TIGR00153 family)